MVEKNTLIIIATILFTISTLIGYMAQSNLSLIMINLEVDNQKLNTAILGFTSNETEMACDTLEIIIPDFKQKALDEFKELSVYSLLIFILGLIFSVGAVIKK